jgi:adenylosuccinate lyase
LVEIEYIALCEVPQLAGVHSVYLVYATFIKISLRKMPFGSKKRRSDQPRCKSVEYFIKDAFEKLGLSEYKEFIHFGLTSQDINNTAIPLSTKKLSRKCTCLL